MPWHPPCALVRLILPCHSSLPKTWISRSLIDWNDHCVFVSAQLLFSFFASTGIELTSSSLLLTSLCSFQGTFEGLILFDSHESSEFRSFKTIQCFNQVQTVKSYLPLGQLFCGICTAVSYILSDARPRIRVVFHNSFLPRKEVIQPHLPIRLPCYDFTPVISLTFDGCSLR